MQVLDRFVPTLRDEIVAEDIVPFIGVYDVMSASIAGRHFGSLFISGFGFAASHYGLPDIGFIAWSDLVGFVQRVRTILPRHNLLVDIDDGYCDVEVAAHVVSMLESVGASGVVLEDQRRPRRCGHFDDKVLLEVDEYVYKLRRVLETRSSMFVVARTDASEFDDVLRRVDAYSKAGADAILVDGIRNLNVLRTISERIEQPIVFNQIAGGNSPVCSLSELKAAGARMVIYSTPCLFAAHEAVDRAMSALRDRDGRLAEPSDASIGVHDCTSILQLNMIRRDEKW